MKPHVQQILGANTLPVIQDVQSAVPQMNGPIGAFNGVFQRAQQLAQSFRNPQALVQNFFPDAPQEISGDPDRLLTWMQQTGKVNPQLVQMARQMMGR